VADDDKGLVDLEEEISGTKFKVSDKPVTEERTPRVPRATKNGNAKTTPPYKAGVIQAGVESTYGGIAMFWSMVDPVCGTAFLECAPKAAEAWEKLAKNNPAVRAMLMRIFTGSAAADVLMAHLPLILAVFAHHGMGRIMADHAENTGNNVRHNEPQYQGFQANLFNQESPGEGVPTPESSYESLFADMEPVPNNGHGMTYKMPENPALRG
jgi:hypothetical protein